MYRFTQRLHEALNRKMRLTLSGFQDIESLELSISGSKIVHISGESGCGKSCIFEAIYWCLYGSVADVEQRGSESKKMFVSCEFENFSIRRQRNPKILTVVQGDRKYENKIAQQKIIEYMRADKEGWLASSYVMQGEPHFLLTLPARDRYNVLLRMSMEGEDAEPQLKKLNEKLREINEQLQNKQQEYNKRLTKYKRLEQESSVTNTHILTQEHREKLELRLSRIQKSIPVLEQKLIVAKTTEAKASVLLPSIQKFQEKSSVLVEYTEEGLEELLTHYDIYMKKKKLIVQQEELTARIAKLERSLNALPELPSIIVSQSLVTETENLERDVSRHKQLALSLNIEYSPEAIAEEKTRLQKLIVRQEEYGLYLLAHKKLQEKERLLQLIDIQFEHSELQIKEQLESLQLSILDLDANLEAALQTNQESYKTSLATALRSLEASFSIKKQEARVLYEREVAELQSCHKISAQILTAKKKELEAAIRTLGSSREVHSCPYCTGSIRYLNNKLEKSSSQPFDNQTYTLEQHKLKELETEIINLNTEYRRSKDRLTSEFRQSVLIDEEKLESDTITKALTAQKDQTTSQLKQNHKEKREVLLRELGACKKESQIWSTFKTNKEKLSQLELDLTSLPELPLDYTSDQKLMSTNEVDTLKKKLEKLNTLIYYNAPDVPSKTLRLILQREDLQLNLEQEEAALAAILVLVRGLEEVKPITEKQLQNYRELLKERLFLEQELKILLVEFAALDQKKSSEFLSTKLERITTVGKKIEERLLNSRDAITLRIKLENLESLYKEHEELYQQALRFQQLQTVIQEAITESLIGMINRVNCFIALACSSIFKEPIDIRLSTEKLLKSGNKKQEINLAVHYKGGFVHNFKKGLSGGEKARINTVLSLAFGAHTSSQILILDEAVSFQDDLTARSLMELVREHTDRITILASQNCNSGLVDESITFDSLKT